MLCYVTQDVHDRSYDEKLFLDDHGMRLLTNPVALVTADAHQTAVPSPPPPTFKERLLMLLQVTLSKIGHLQAIH